MIPRLVLAGAIGLAFAASGHACSPPPGRTDHHVHVHSPEIRAYLPDYCASPGRIGACDPAFTRPLTTDDLLKDMNRAGTRRAVLISTGYLAQSPMMVPSRPDPARLVHAVNAFTVNEARVHPDRLAAFIGVNPLTPGRPDGHGHQSEPPPCRDRKSTRSSALSVIRSTSERPPLGVNLRRAMIFTHAIANIDSFG